MTYLHILDQPFLRVLEDAAQISRNRDPRRDLDARVQHPEGVLELRVLNDGERPVTSCYPQCELDTEAGVAVCRALGKGSDGLLAEPTVGGSITLLSMTHHIACGTVVGLAVADFVRIPSVKRQ